MEFKQSISFPWFEVSPCGQIRNPKTGRILKQTLSKDGYRRITTRREGRVISMRVHRVVAEVYCDNPENKDCVNHIDGDKLNNIASNLEWCTVQENNDHAARLGLRGATLLDQDDADNIRLLYAEGVSVRDISVKFSISRSHTYRIINNDRW